MHHVDFYYDFISPYSYLAATRLPAFATGHRVRIDWRPFLLPQLMKMTGNVPPSTIRKKGRYLWRDLQRWADHLGVPFKMQNPVFFDARPALCAAQALAGDDRVVFSQAVFRTLWSGGFKPDHPGWVEEIMTVHGLPLKWARPANEPALMQQLHESTETACRAGAFGAPTFILHGGGRPQLFWGVDRMDFLARAIQNVRREK